MVEYPKSVRLSKVDRCCYSKWSDSIRDVCGNVTQRQITHGSLCIAESMSCVFSQSTRSPDQLWKTLKQTFKTNWVSSYLGACLCLKTSSLPLVDKAKHHMFRGVRWDGVGWGAVIQLCDVQCLQCEWTLTMHYFTSLDDVQPILFHNCVDENHVAWIIIIIIIVSIVIIIIIKKWHSRNILVPRNFKVTCEIKINDVRKFDAT